MNTNNDKNKMGIVGKMKASFSGRKFRSGAYATITSVIVIAIVLIVNLIVSKMNITFDVSQNKDFSLTSQTKDMLKDLKDDITIYYMVQQGHEVNEFEKIAKQYEKYSNKVKLVSKDPVLYPQFAKQYVTDSITENSFIVVDNVNNRAKYIDQQEMVIQEMDYQTYQTNVTGTDAEGKLTSAIQYVTTENLPKMYVVQGHGETATPDSFNSAMDKMNIEVDTLTTLTESSVPEDCSMLYINAPQKDFTEDETTMIKNYLTAGGKAIITLDYNSTSLPNFASILDYYGIEMVNGIVVEGNKNMYVSGYQNALIPTLNSHDITNQASGDNVPVFMPTSAGLTIADNIRSSLKVEPLLQTSTDSYAKTNMQSTTFEKESGDIDGPFYLGLAATDTYNDVTSSIVVYSSLYTFADETSTYGNAKLLPGTVGFLSGNQDTISIPAKSYGGTFIYPSELQAFSWGAAVTLGLPIIIIIIGAVICFRRRKR